MAPRYRVTLNEDERSFLNDIAHNGKNAAKKITAANVLLLCDAGEHDPAKKVDDVAKTFGISDRTIEHIKSVLWKKGWKPPLSQKSALSENR